MASFTIGQAGVPSQEIRNLDALIAQSLANYQRTLVDAASSSNALFRMIRNRGMMKAVNGGTHISVPLMYGLNDLEWYDGYDTLATKPQDGVTQVLYDWAQASTPIMYSEKERKQNKQRILDLIQTKIMQAEMGIQEGFNKALLQGSLSNDASGSTITNPTNPSTGASGINPLAKLVAKDPTASLVVGNLEQSTNTFWQNRSKSSTASTYDDLLLELDNLNNTCARGSGGAPDIMICDQVTFELLNFAYFQRYRTSQRNESFPFDNIRFRNMTVVWDEFVPDLENDVANTDTKGTAWLLNSKFFWVKYEEETNFVPGPFQKPPRQDARVSDILWMGNVCVSNRRKQGVLYNIARTLST